VQNELARAEAYTICNTDNQYIVPTSGNPIRGLIQDHVSSAVKLTCKNSYLTKAEFQQLLYIAVYGLPGTEIVSSMETIVTPPPTIWKPTPLWTGKQVVSAILAHLCRHPLPALQLDSKARTPATAFSAEHAEHEVVIRNGELLFGVIDKNAIGNASLGLVHAVYELYGAELASRLLNSFARVFTFHLQNAGHSCLIEDLVLQEKSDKERRSLLNKVDEVTHDGLIQFLESDGMSSSQHQGAQKQQKKKSMQELRPDLARFLNGTRDRKDGKVKLDAAMQQHVNKSASDVIKACLPNGLRTSFLNNHFALMVSTGAKGSAVNQSQITCFLGQQALEGQRVPVMASGKTLPSFPAFDGSARAGGFVRDRFLTGVKPQEYYFHCMAGREGLVDTAVKTSRSGYLQRCLVKHLEELNVCYDYTVRDSGQNVVQFLYGEDGIDTVNNALLGGKNNQFLFLARNHRALTYKFSLHAQFFQQGLEMDTATRHHDLVARAKQLVRDTDKLLHNNNNAAKQPSSEQRAEFLQCLVQKGNVVLARQRRDPTLAWTRDNLLMGWFPAEIVKVRSDKDKDSSSSSKQKASRAFPLVDLLYYGEETHLVEKKVPVALWMKPSTSSSSTSGDLPSQQLPVYLLSPGLPDPAMAVLRLGSAVGACSERVQQAFREYVLKNPDNIIAPAESSSSNAVTRQQQQSPQQLVSADAMELLLWVKFMRSFAAPGESVGCVAAQSVGEPSTQMTLNTFHLAGHGGANVTLGIPRLREILMTASRSPKTPTMQLPCVAGTSRAAAQALSRHLSRLTLAEMLDHRGGIVVGEQIVRAHAYSRWERKYRLRLQLLPLAALHSAFSVTGEEIVEIVQTAFLAKLDYLLKLEQRRAGENTGGKNDPLKQFRGLAPGKTGDVDDAVAAASTGRKRDDDDVDGGVGELPDLNNNKKSRGGSAKRFHVHEEGEDSEMSEDDDDDDGSVDSAAERRARPSSSNKKSSSALEDSDDEEEEEDDDVSDHDGEGRPRNHKSKRVLDELSVGSLDSKDEAEIDRLVSDFKEFDETAGVDDEDEDNEDEDRRNQTATKKKNGSGSSNNKKSRKSTGSSSSNKNAHLLVEFNGSEHWIEVTLFLPVTSRRILLAQLAEKAAANTTIRATKNIARAYVEKDESRKQTEHFLVGTEGVNFPAIWALPDSLVEHNLLHSNDVWQILLHYGVEAARASIVQEIQAVFAVYGIDVNVRHLSLIADFMTRSGGYNAMNRIGMLQCASPFLQMSFETTCTFLTKAVQEGLVDTQQSPSSRIVLGSAPRAGTGCFELLAPLSSSSSSSSSSAAAAAR
jgi:DNA-directed RNA polymerase I subunit RPA1